MTRTAFFRHSVLCWRRFCSKGWSLAPSFSFCGREFEETNLEANLTTTSWLLKGVVISRILNFRECNCSLLYRLMTSECLFVVCFCGLRTLSDKSPVVILLLWWFILKSNSMDLVIENGSSGHTTVTWVYTLHSSYRKEADSLIIVFNGNLPPQGPSHGIEPDYNP